jgi:hypothetical protein
LIDQRVKTPRELQRITEHLRRNQHPLSASPSARSQLRRSAMSIVTSTGGTNSVEVKCVGYLDRLDLDLTRTFRSYGARYLAHQPAIDIPSLRDSRNHLSTERLRQRMRTDVFYWHGYTEMLRAGRWVKATPAFNIELCDKFRLLPLEFDGRNDSLYHPFDKEGNRHMEYVSKRGSYADLPLAEIIQTFREKYGFAGCD